MFSIRTVLNSPRRFQFATEHPDVMAVAKLTPQEKSDPEQLRKFKAYLRKSFAILYNKRCGMCGERSNLTPMWELGMQVSTWYLDYSFPSIAQIPCLYLDNEASCLSDYSS